jgi:formyl-CoA transferase
VRGLVAEVPTENGVTRMLGIPIKLSATPGRVERRPPRFGEDTDAVLAELGLSASEIADLRAKGVAS